MSPDAALTICRFLHYASAMFLWGASAYLWTLVPLKLAQDVGRRLRSFYLVAIAVAVATTALALPLETARIGEGWIDATNPTTIRDVLFDTNVGQAWLAQAIAAAILLATLALPLHGQRAAIALASGLVLGSVTLTGHAVMQEGWVRVAHRLNDIVHVLCAAAWVGAVVPLLVILKGLEVDERRSQAEVALRRFSTAGHIVVALVILSGGINTALVLGRWPAYSSSPYQAMLEIKIALVALMVGVATANRYVLVPKLARPRLGATNAIRLGTFAEFILGVGVIGLVSVFGTLDPM